MATNSNQKIAPPGKQYVNGKLYDIPGYKSPQPAQAVVPSQELKDRALGQYKGTQPAVVPAPTEMAPLVPGVFTNKTTGATTNAQGQPVDATGKVIVTETAPTPEKYPGSTRYDQQGNQLPAEVLTGREQLAALGEDLFPGQKTVYGSIEEELKAMVDSQKKEKEQLRKDIDIANKGEELSVADAKRAGERAIEGTTATFAQSREAPMSATNPQVASDFANITNQRIGFAVEQKEAARVRREGLMGQLEDAQREGRAARVIELQNEISQAQAAEMEAAAKIMDEEDKATKTALELMKFDQDIKDSATTAVTSQFEKMGPGIVGMSLDNLAAMIEGTNITLPAALAWQAGAKLEQEALQSKNIDEHNEKMLQAEKLKAEMKNIGKPSQVLEYEYYQTLPPAEQAKFRELKNAGYGFMKMQNADGSESLIATNQNTGQAQLLYGGGGKSGGQIPHEPPVTEKIGNKSVSAQPIFMTALQQADADMFAATGQHININQSFRTADQQQAIRNKFGYTSNDQKSGEGGLAMAAPVGTSFHEMGLAVDVSNWKEAQPYLEKYGIVNGLKGDMGHFSMGELNPGVFGGAEEEAALLSVPKDLRSSVTQKAGQFDTEQQVKNFQTAQTVWNKVQSVPNDTKNPQDDQLLVYAFAKAMDPNSAVKEGEYETVQQYAQTSLQRFGVDAERFYSNVPFLSEEARKNIKDSIKKAYNAEKDSYDQVRKGYIKTIDNLAGKSGVGEKILQDYTLMEQPESAEKKSTLFSNLLGYVDEAVENDPSLFFIKLKQNEDIGLDDSAQEEISSIFNNSSK